MPLYEYECDACGLRFEKVQKFSDPLEDTCPKCGGPVHKLISSPAIQFKGSGFYITDYAKKDYVSASKADGNSADGKSDGKGEGKSDSSTTEKGGNAGKTDSAASSEKSTSSTDSSSSGSSSSSTTTKSET